MPKCLICGESFPNAINIDGKMRNLQRRKCCLKCSPFGEHHTRTLEFHNQTNKYCKCCGRILRKRQKVFCTNKCQTEYEYRDYIQKWKNGLENGMSGKYGLSHRIKRYIFEKYDYKCSKCGWHEVNPFTENIPLEIHHKDGNYMNNHENNLELLCPNCHSLTETYKNGNKGKGRQERKYSDSACQLPQVVLNDCINA